MAWASKKKDGYWAGYTDYRHGSAKPVTLARTSIEKKVEPIFSQKKRQLLVSEVVEMMQDWRLTRFEKEGATRTGLRSALCLDGYCWPEADSEAARCVSAALRALGAERPSWAEGQRQHTDSPDRCSWCTGPIDDEDRTDGQRFCSVDCARAAIDHRGNKDQHVFDVVQRAAYRLIAKRASEKRPCRQCGKLFQNDRKDAEFCSSRCVSRWQKGDALRQLRQCVECGAEFMPGRKDSECCSKACATTKRHKYARAMLAEEIRICNFCSDPYTPTSARQKYCSEKCTHNAAVLAYETRKRSTKVLLHELVCQVCEEPFTSKVSWALTCCPEHKVKLNRMKEAAKKRQQRDMAEVIAVSLPILTAEIFDSWFQRAA